MMLPSVPLVLPTISQSVIFLMQVAFFVNSGSEANDLAMKMARLYSGNYDFLALRNGYHGKRGLNAHSTWRYNMPQVEPCVLGHEATHCQ